MVRDRSPQLVILAGPNGAGKSTAAPILLRGSLNVRLFVNADTIAAGLAAYDPADAALAASRLMLERLRELSNRRVDFAFETTLAGRTLLSWLPELHAAGYRTHLVYLWLPSPEFAVSRVVGRVAQGGHDVEPETVRLRYWRGIRNLVAEYIPAVSIWRVYNNEAASGPRLVATGEAGSATRIARRKDWDNIQEQSRHVE